MFLAAASPLRSPNRTRRVERISMAVPQVSQSPCAKCASPAENSAPGAPTGMSSVAPAPSCLMSTFPACSRGGMVRSASAAIRGSAGTADAGDGGSTSPPRSSRACSLAMVAGSSSRPGGSPIVPMNGEPGMRTPGRPADAAQPSAISQSTLNGSGNSSRKNPNPGSCTVNPYRSGSISRISTASRSPARPPPRRPARSADAPRPGPAWPARPP